MFLEESSLEKIRESQKVQENKYIQTHRHTGEEEEDQEYVLDIMPLGDDEEEVQEDQPQEQQQQLVDCQEQGMQKAKLLHQQFTQTLTILDLQQSIQDHILTHQIHLHNNSGKP